MRRLPPPCAFVTERRGPRTKDEIFTGGERSASTSGMKNFLNFSLLVSCTLVCFAGPMFSLTLSELRGGAVNLKTLSDDEEKGSCGCICEVNRFIALGLPILFEDPGLLGTLTPPPVCFPVQALT